MNHNAIFLMGPTASGKTELAISLCERFPCDIISVDSAMVYRGMNIGTAKPDTASLQRVEHQLVDILDPEKTYSAGDFVRDARAAIRLSSAKGRIPILVGGTMMYFRALTEGMAKLPAKNPVIRDLINREANKRGWPAIHAELESYDPETAARLNPNDSQRIQRALEVFRISGKPISQWYSEAVHEVDDLKYIKISLIIEPRSLLHERIERRLDQMINNGFEKEMESLRCRPGLSRNSTAMRSVGYRQFWAYLDGDYSRQEARDRTLFATRQLAKRQLTWLRSEKNAFLINPLEVDAIDTISAYLAEKLG
ncbi:MAG: tRNA (adenosine(37)-N6)-dimethylallyltransferase MiaA [Woeseiaceae bacterium]|nr:tRNA (adenosine(37)-N6)-dimethylallyltransferase MiaA [Woeseiaceae bacterium]